MTPRASIAADRDSFPIRLHRRDWFGRVALSGLLASAARPRMLGADRRPSILLYSGWAVHNIGDIGHTPGTLRYLAEHLPEARVSCWLRKTSPAVTGMLRRRFPDVALIEDSNLDVAGKASTPSLQEAFDSADLFVQNSGMHFTRFWQPPTGILKACIARGKPFGLYGQSFDGFRKEDADILPALLSKAAFIFTRDNESLAFLRGAGVSSPVLEFGPDGCFGIDVRDDERASAFLREHQLQPKRFLCMILRTDKEIARNPADQGEVLPGGPDAWAEKLREVIVDWVTRTGDRVALVPEVEKEIGPMKSMILDKLPEAIREHVAHRPKFWYADEAASVYARAHAVVSIEPHSCIMAVASGTPIIHFFTRRHGNKAWMFRDIGLPEWLIDIDSEPASAATAALKRIGDDYELAEIKVRRAMNFVNARSAEMMREVGRLLPKHA